MRPELALLDTIAAKAFAGRRVLITGASGFVGGHFARQALAAGVDAVTTGRRPALVGLPFQSSDLNDPIALMKSVRIVEPELIFHFASPGVAHGTANFDEILHALITGGEALLRAACDLPKPPHFFQIGSGLEYAHQSRPIREGDPIVPAGSAYGAAKAAASALLGGFAGHLPITLIRPFNLIGAGDTSPRLGNWVIDNAVAGVPIQVTAGEQIRDYLHVDDFCRLVWKLAEQATGDHTFQVFNAGSGDPRSVRSYIESLVACLNEAGRSATVDFGAVEYRRGEPMISIPDLTRLRAATDWRPRIGFDAGIAEFVDWKLARCP